MLKPQKRIRRTNVAHKPDGLASGSPRRARVPTKSTTTTRAGEIIKFGRHGISVTLDNPATDGLTRDGSGQNSGGVHAQGEARTISDAAERIDERFIDPTILAIREGWKRWQCWTGSETGLTNQASAICRSVSQLTGKNDRAGLARAAALLKRIETGMMTETENAVAISVQPLLESREILRRAKKPLEKELIRLAKILPVSDWITSTKGVSHLWFAAIIGEAGAIGAYRTVSGLWKRMGLAVIDGERQRKCADKDKAIAHAYSPHRRSVMWNVGGGLIGCMGLGPRPNVGEDISTRDDLSPYQKLFVGRLRHLATVEPKHRRPHAMKNGVARESYSKHAAASAKRYVEKRFLRDLYAQWRLASGRPPPLEATQAADLTADKVWQQAIDGSYTGIRSPVANPFRASGASCQKCDELPTRVSQDVIHSAQAEPQVTSGSQTAPTTPAAINPGANRDARPAPARNSIPTTSRAPTPEAPALTRLENTCPPI